MFRRDLRADFWGGRTLTSLPWDPVCLSRLTRSRVAALKHYCNGDVDGDGSDSGDGGDGGDGDVDGDGGDRDVEDKDRGQPGQHNHCYPKTGLEINAQKRQDVKQRHTMPASTKTIFINFLNNPKTLMKLILVLLLVLTDTFKTKFGFQIFRFLYFCSKAWKLLTAPGRGLVVQNISTSSVSNRSLTRKSECAPQENVDIWTFVEALLSLACCSQQQFDVSSLLSVGKPSLHDMKHNFSESPFFRHNFT